MKTPQPMVKTDQPTDRVSGPLPVDRGNETELTDARNRSSIEQQRLDADLGEGTMGAPLLAPYGG